MLCLVRKLFICLLLLFCFNARSYAYVSQDYLEYAYQNLADNGYISNYSSLNATLSSYTAEDYTYLTQKVNEYLDEFEIPNVTDSNVSVLLLYDDSSILTQNRLQVKIIISNNTKPHGYDNLAFLSLNKTYYIRSEYDQLGYYGDTGDNLYIITNTLKIDSNNNLTVNDFTTETFTCSSTGNFLIGANGTNSFISSNMTFNDELTIAYNDNFSVTMNQAFYITYPYEGGVSQDLIAFTPLNYSGAYYVESDIPDDESGDSGDSGSSNLLPVINGIDKINNKLDNISQQIPTSGEIKETISGEIGKVTETLTTVPDLSGEIITKQEIDDALSLDFMADPYDNFWYELTTGLSHALTDDVRQYDIPWINGYVYTFNLDTWGLKFPPAIEFVLRSMSVIAITWVIVKYWKIIVDKISSGSIDEVLAMNEEEGIIDLF